MSERLVVRGAREHNLRNVDIDLPRDQLIVFTGISGSGKSSLAFDTIYAEGQRRYVESLSAYARQFLGQMDKPDVDFIEGLSPAISIDQKSASRNPRSTVGTITEVYDYLRLLFARIGVPHDPETGERLVRQTPQQIVDRVLEMEEGTRFQVLAPVVRGRKGTYDTLLEDLASQGFSRAIVDGQDHDLGDEVDLARYEMHTIEVVVDRLVLREGIGQRLTESMETALALAEGVAEIQIVPRSDDEEPTRIIFSQHLSRPSDGKSFEELAPRNFSFNSPYGACSHCDGLGSVFEVDSQLVVPNPELSLGEGAIAPWSGGRNRYFSRLIESVAEDQGIDMATPWQKLPAKTQKMLLDGGLKERIQVRYKNRFGRTRVYSAHFEGVMPQLRRRHRESESDAQRDQIEGYMRQVPCPKCQGARLNPLSLAVTIGGKNLHDICALPIGEATQALESLELSDRDLIVAEPVLKEVNARLGFLLDVGLDYLSLSRSAATLAGGEAQRIRLASQIGSGLVGVLYVLDEPSIGLHQRDNQRLIETLVRLRNLGNTVIVVEHDEETILQADHVVDIGPGAGEHGGAVVFEGTVKGLLRSKNSVTGQYLSGRKSIAIPEQRRPGNGEFLTVQGARENNLQNLDVAFPLGVLVAVTGVSGSGKSTLVNEILHKSLMQSVYKSKVPPGLHKGLLGAEAVDKVINIDQAPIGRTPRSNAATYTGVFDHVRKLFAKTEESRVRGYQPGRFSFNVKGGRCEACSGDGTLKIEMHFLPDVYVPCEVCKGKRYNRDTLDIEFKGRTVADILAMSCEEALEFFDRQPPIVRHMQTLVDVGLGYIRLGQPAPTLSGGEAQRVKLASELAKRSTGHTMYILDEPTTGLHFEDVRKLLGVLNRLVEQGNTVIVIEHNLDVVKTADWVIDLGPKGGVGGGTVVATGTPEDVAQVKKSYTGRFLKELF
ncbi:MAG: excinuclease ABC subunit UvrA [Actinobacteria bacterium]|jgi:excinuclease ABC subunit A|nr:excinuclease ABC subunit UvrA [Actinomycetota bacterium]MBT3746548.1 excinuclease ABC subunit UvrA [Actinomycetota bacterium]MBT3970333.1 excinuclease ABC subunit UvrA [Actinomycetota bacterium]MBT4010464.1 excinuclease ABC subunit UvrA [Actinomycetota bacterium]MBT4303566.1 excinuclease ABC subunit UvrA [Actinomycetota bacterium]